MSFLEGIFFAENAVVGLSPEINVCPVAMRATLKQTIPCTSRKQPLHPVHDFS